MTNKVHKIEKWIKEKISCWYYESLCEVPELPKQIIEGKILALREMLSFINSLQEEPVSEDLEDAAKYYIPDESYHMIIESKEEGSGENVYDYIQMIDMFKAGAKWQKGKMIAMAIDGTARPDDNEILCNLASSNLKDGDKVKVIVIKED